MLSYVELAKCCQATTMIISHQLKKQYGQATTHMQKDVTQCQLPLIISLNETDHLLLPLGQYLISVHQINFILVHDTSGKLDCMLQGSSKNARILSAVLAHQVKGQGQRSRSKVTARFNITYMVTHRHSDTHS